MDLLNKIIDRCQKEKEPPKPETVGTVFLDDKEIGKVRDFHFTLQANDRLTKDNWTLNDWYKRSR